MRWKDKGRKRKAGLISARPHANLLCKLAVKSIPGTALKRDFLGECAGSAVGRLVGRPAGRQGSREMRGRRGVEGEKKKPPRNRNSFISAR